VCVELFGDYVVQYIPQLKYLIRSHAVYSKDASKYRPKLRPVSLDVTPETEFLDVIGTKVVRAFLLAIHSHLYLRILLSPPLSKSGLKTVCNVNIVHENLQSDNSQDYAQKPKQNCTQGMENVLFNNQRLKFKTERENAITPMKNIKIPPYVHCLNSGGRGQQDPSCLLYL
jgi:hypothetical protein